MHKHKNRLRLLIKSIESKKKSDIGKDSLKSMGKLVGMGWLDNSQYCVSIILEPFTRIYTLKQQ